jgi:transmembrane sensor
MTPDRPDPLPDTPGPIDWEALARYLAGESSPAEVEQVRAWLAAHPSDAALLESLDGHLDRLAAPDTTAPGPDVEAALREVNGRRDGAKVLPLRDGRAPVASPLRGTRFIAPRTPPGERPVAEGSAWRGPALRAAALVAIVAGGYAAVRALDREEGTTPPATVAATMLATATGERDSVRLGDGTLVVLGPESRLEVAAGFGDDRRDVTLVGDGYFEVQHDDARPFTVHAAGASVRDIGTVFTVRARGDAPVTVIVTRGAVLLRAADRGKAEGVVLHERDRGTLAPGGSPSARPRWPTCARSSVAGTASSCSSWTRRSPRAASRETSARHRWSARSTCCGSRSASTWSATDGPCACARAWEEGRADGTAPRRTASSTASARDRRAARRAPPSGR